jgi:hypothetical protein
VVKLAEGNAWWTWHDRSRGKNKRGWPDLVCIRERVVYAELKKVGECMRPEQQEVYSMLVDAGQEVYLWTILDWSEIQTVLR